MYLFYVGAKKLKVLEQDDIIQEPGSFATAVKLAWKKTLYSN